MTINQRLEAIIHETGLSLLGFAEEIGIKQQTLYNYVVNGREPSYSALEKIASAYPGINMEWLISGKGDMFKSGALVKNEIIDTRPRVPLTAAAGSLSGESIGVTLEQCEQMPLIHQIASYDFTMFIKGDSMSPRFESGDEIACRRIDQSRFIQWGKVHVLDTTQGFIIKRIYDDGDKIRCVSYNKDYADFSIPKEDIFSISLVVGSISIMEM